MRRPSLNLAGNLTAALRGRIIEAEGMRLRLDWSEFGATEWQLKDEESGDVVVHSATLERLEEAFKTYVRRVKNAPFKRTRCIVVPRWGGEPWEGTVSSWASTSRFQQGEVWVIKDDDGSGNAKKERVELERLRVWDEKELDALTNLRVDRMLLAKRITMESGRLAEALKPLELNDKDHPRFGSDGKQIMRDKP